jgi:hypothetical protein
VIGTLAFAFVGVALLCVVAGVVSVTRTRRAAREDEEDFGSDDDEMTYAEEAAAVAAAEAAAAKAADAEAPGTGGAPLATRDGRDETPTA